MILKRAFMAMGSGFLTGFLFDILPLDNFSTIQFYIIRTVFLFWFVVLVDSIAFKERVED